MEAHMFTFSHLNKQVNVASTWCTCPGRPSLSCRRTVQSQGGKPACLTTDPVRAVALIAPRLRFSVALVHTSSLFCHGSGALLESGPYQGSSGHGLQEPQCSKKVRKATKSTADKEEFQHKPTFCEALTPACDVKLPSLFLHVQDFNRSVARTRTCHDIEAVNNGP